MTKHIELKRFNQGTALTTGTLALPPLVIEGLAEFNGSFERLCLKAGTAAIEAMLAADAEQFCGKRYQRYADRQGYRWGLIGSEVGWHGGKAAIRRPRVRERGGAEVACRTNFNRYRVTLRILSWRASPVQSLLGDHHVGSNNLLA
jgi:hypothetical protein